MKNATTTAELQRIRQNAKTGRFDERRNWATEEAAEYLGCTTDTLKVWTSKRRVPFVRVGRLVRFRKRDLDAWLDKNLVPAQAR
jgi:excisionase family DNA binding protein